MKKKEKEASVGEKIAEVMESAPPETILQVTVIPKTKKGKVVKKVPEAKAKKEKQKSFIMIMKDLMDSKTSDKEITKLFTSLYKAKGVTDVKFIAGRISIYKKIASKKVKK